MSPVSVLLVDDSPLFLDITTRFLQEECQGEVVVVGVAGGGEEALAKAQPLHPQVVLVDLNMPGMSGLEAIPRLRQALPDAGIIALTLLDAEVYRQAALAAGADGFVSKSTLYTDLLPAIRRFKQRRIASSE
jgi:DNA-binding NarL/FixJ family response regulator